MGAFRKFIESIVPFGQTKRISRKIKDYKPGTFGIEIEFLGDIDPYDINYEYARKSFNQRVEQPADYQNWLTNNPEPEEPDKESYEWDEDDAFSNYHHLYPEGVHVDKSLPKFILDFFKNYYNYFVDVGLMGEFQYLQNNVINFLNGLYTGKNFQYSSKTVNMFESEIKFNKWKNKWYNFFGNLHNDSYLSNVKIDIIKEIEEESVKALEYFIEFHTNKAQSINKKDYQDKIEAIYQKDLEKFHEKYNEWEEESEEVKDKWENWDEDKEFDIWLKSNIEYFRNDPDVNNDIDDLKRWFIKNKKPVVINTKGAVSLTSWNIFEDEAGIVEIASPILTTKDFGFLQVLLSYLSDKTFDVGTGLHVHIGMPKDIDAFDLLSIAYIIDEKSILDIADRSEESLSNYSREKKDLFRSLYMELSSKTYSNVEMINLLNLNLGKHLGTNIIKSFIEHGTVEIRYLSSKIVKNPNKLLESIQYFLLLPRIAKSRTQINYSITNNNNIIFTRKPGQKIEVQKDFKKAPQSNLPVATLKEPEKITTKRELMLKHGKPIS